MLNGQEILRARWSDHKKPYKPVFHTPEEQMPDFQKPKQIVSLNDARQVAAIAAKNAKPSHVLPPEVVQKKWATLAKMRMARSEKTGKRKQA